MAIFFQGIYVTRVSEGGPAEVAGLQIGDKIMQVTLQGENEAWLLPPKVPGKLTRLTSPLEEAGEPAVVFPASARDIKGHQLGVGDGGSEALQMTWVPEVSPACKP